MKFHFPTGTAGYTELITKPGLRATAVMDRDTHHILSVKFLNRTRV